jgi:DTW domain-containing protein YfiP
MELNDAIQSPAVRSALAARASVEHVASASSSSEVEQTEVKSLLACQYVLLVIDGTWQQAREMFSAIFAWLPPSTHLVTMSQAPFLSGQVRGCPVTA